MSADLDERRSSDRRPVLQESTLRDEALRPHPVLVHDLSCDGCLIESDTPMMLGATIGIGLPGVGRRDATVVRVEGTLHGCSFAGPLSQSAIDQAFAADPVVLGAFSRLSSHLDLSGEPAVERWPAPVRAAIIVGSTVLLWTAILVLV
ncbi:hypothetical protein ASG07_15520 [Sphingomonas sp. Leaf343]|nr:hypothetical protein ASG07_15520 [Sphingomonas sp. Leaf343]